MDILGWKIQMFLFAFEIRCCTKRDFFFAHSVLKIRNYHLAVARMFICGSKRVCRVEQKATLPSFLVVLAGMCM